jgi:membrane protein DedA with SNARE-associated domain
VQEFLTQLLGNSQGLLAYATVFFILVICGLGVPLPEDISLILGGFLAHKGAANLPVMMVVGFAGILVGDSLIFFAGRRLGSQVGRTSGGLLSKVITAEKRARVAELFARHGQKIVMIARFMPGVRAVTYFTAGSVGMAYWRFILWDGLAAILSAPFFVWLGFYFGDKLDLVFDRLKDGQAVVLALVVVGGLVWLWRRRAAQRQAAGQQGAAPTLLREPEPAPLFEVAEKPASKPVELRK